MQINNITISTDKCKKPCFLGSMEPAKYSGSNKKVRYKHYEELSDDVLKARSIIKAHQDVQKGAKMRLYKALPIIATGLVTGSIALTRPGKLSEKLVTGLGFLATLAGIDALGNIAFNSKKEDTKKSFATLGALGAIGVGISAVSKDTKKVSIFLKNEAKQLAKEIDKTNLAKNIGKKIEPLIKEHPKMAFWAPIATVLTTGAINTLASVGLLKGMSKDIKSNAIDNYEKAKMIQKIAKNHFDSVDAIEV